MWFLCAIDNESDNYLVIFAGPQEWQLRWAEKMVRKHAFQMSKTLLVTFKWEV